MAQTNLATITPDNAVEQLWNLGNLSYKLRPEQRYFRSQIYANVYQLIVGNISRRWGKTHTLVSYAIEQAIRSRQNIRFGCAFLTDLEEFVLPAFDLLLEDCPRYLKPVYKASKKRWVFPNGSIIKLVGLDKNPNGLRGNAINIIIIDEAGFVSNLRYIYTSVIIPATMKQRNIKIIMISTPPESPEHFFVEMINKAKIQDNAFYLELTIDDISDLEEPEKERLFAEVGGRDSPTAQREFFCKIIIDATRAIAPHFNEQIHVGIAPDEILKHVDWHLFGDTGGVRDLTVFHQMGWSHDLGRIIVHDEQWFERHTPTSKITDAVIDKWNFMPTTLDATGQLQIDWSAAGLPSSNPIKDTFTSSLMTVNNSFYNNEVLINPRCKLLIQTLKNHMTNPKRTDFERTETTGHADAVMSYCYGIRGVDRITDLRPKPPASSVFRHEKPDQIETELAKIGFR